MAVPTFQKLQGGGGQRVVDSISTDCFANDRGGKRRVVVTVVLVVVCGDAGILRVDVQRAVSLLATVIG